MWQFSDRNRRNLREISRAKDLDYVEAADRHVGELAIGVAHDIDVVGDRSRVYRLQQLEWWMCVEHLNLTGVLEREPDLGTIRSSRDVRTERACLGHVSDDLVIGYTDDHRLWGERREDVAVGAIGGKELHAWAIRDGDAGLLLICRTIQNGDIILTPHGHPDLFAVWREECLVG